MVSKEAAVGGALATSVVVGGTVYGTSAKGGFVEPGWTVLIMDDNFRSNHVAGDIGWKYSWYLTGTYGAADGSTVNNEGWWRKSYLTWQKDLQKKEPLSTDFQDNQKIRSHYSPLNDANANADKALNKVCQKLYKQKTDYLKGSTGTSDDKAKLNKDLWRYCSPLGEKPKTIKETGEQTYASSSNQVYGKESESTLISVTDPRNDLFWDLRNRNFFGKGNNHEWAIGNGLKQSEDALFFGLWSGDKKNIKETCTEAYLIEKNNSSGKFKDADITKFCAWNNV